ncbi:hypothetical protein [Streptomyces clavuligerus]|uniref:hypothetical protein n=1 Tax=Streptomyces clavuligerus TaxID=1901 RepID=UPI00018008B3|nr:hypothetical protein [Streptomyces clavuligerus]EDY52979.1 hypothetical protein SSCG_06061 [Streptomyces clavuligerus]WDN56005.1 hypothetical protein LL058_29405 [Streptomyces clavuligerus]
MIQPRQTYRATAIGDATRSRILGHRTPDGMVFVAAHGGDGRATARRMIPAGTLHQSPTTATAAGRRRRTGCIKES